MPSALEHGDLLRLVPAELVDDVLTHGVASDAWATAALCLSEQMQAAGEPPEALELCYVGVARAAEQVASGAIDAAARDTMQRTIQAQTHGFPVLARWMRALDARIRIGAEFAAAADLLLRARTTWAVLEEVR